MDPPKKAARRRPKKVQVNEEQREDGTSAKATGSRETTTIVSTTTFAKRALGVRSAEAVRGRCPLQKGLHAVPRQGCTGLCSVPGEGWKTDTLRAHRRG